MGWGGVEVWRGGPAWGGGRGVGWGRGVLVHVACRPIASVSILSAPAAVFHWRDSVGDLNFVIGVLMAWLAISLRMCYRHFK